MWGQIEEAWPRRIARISRQALSLRGNDLGAVFAPNAAARG